MTWLAGRQNRVVGAAAGSTLALALLVCGCVFAAIAGPALSLHTRSQALHQTLAKLTPTAESLQVSGNWADFAGPLAENGAGGVANLTPGQLVAATHEMAHGFAALPLPLGPGQWAGLTTNLYDAFGVGPRAQAGGKPELELAYRDVLTSNARVVAGSYASAAAPAGTGMLMGGATAEGFLLPLIIGISVLSFAMTATIVLSPSEAEIRSDADLLERIGQARAARQ